MTEHAPPAPERIRAAEIIAASCLATDLGMGFPFEHGLHATLVAMRLADLLGVDVETASQTYYVSLLMYSGCTTDAQIGTVLFPGGQTKNITPVQFGGRMEVLPAVARAVSSPGGTRVRRAYQVATGLPKAARYLPAHFAALCEVASMLAERLGLPAALQDLFGLLTERWDGRSVLGRARGEEIPLPLRIVQVARDAAYQRVVGGDEHAVATIRDRAGRAFDPKVATAFADEAAELFGVADVGGSVWEEALAAEPRPSLTLEDEQIDRALAAVGDFADLASPLLAGHSRGVARAAATAGSLYGLEPEEVRELGRAGHVHDVGRAAVDPVVWQKAGPLTADDWEQVRLHPYQTERLLARSSFLASLGRIACAHHERLDGSGYHRGDGAMTLSPRSRLLAAADVFHAMQEPRAHRPAMGRDAVAATMEEEARAGRLDPQAVAAVLEAAGMPAPKVERPAGLTEREVEVVGLLARGRQTKQVARALGISVKTADRHIQNAYRKMGVSTRAGATLFAMEHGLVPWGEFPIPR